MTRRGRQRDLERFARFRLHIDARSHDIVSLQGYGGDIGRRDNGREVLPTRAGARRPKSGAGGMHDAEFLTRPRVMPPLPGSE